MTRYENTPFTAVFARLGVPTDDGRVLIPTRAGKASLEAVRDIPVMCQHWDGIMDMIGIVDRVEVMWGSAIAYGHIRPVPMRDPCVKALRAGAVHLNPEFGTVDMEETPDGTLRVWTYPLRSLVFMGPSAWSDMPRVRILG